MHAVSPSIIDHHFRLVFLKAFFHSAADFLTKLLVCCITSHTNSVLDKLLSKRISRINREVVSVYYIVLEWILVISLVTVTLVSIKVNYHKLLHFIPLLHIACYKSYVWVNAKSTSRTTCGVMKSSSKIDCPTFLARKTRSINTTLRCTCHRI